MRGVTRWCIRLCITKYISTHTPHARRDFKNLYSIRIECHFYSHASCEAWRIAVPDNDTDVEFLLTRLMRGVTEWKILYQRIYFHFYSHASCEAWHSSGSSSLWSSPFLLTRLMRGVTLHRRRMEQLLRISTHTPHARRDIVTYGSVLTAYDFYSHASCEAWLFHLYSYLWWMPISTHTPHARRDIWTELWKMTLKISTHTPHARRDMWRLLLCLIRSNFYSHASCEAWRRLSKRRFFRLLFLLTRLMRGVTLPNTTL